MNSYTLSYIIIIIIDSASCMQNGNTVTIVNIPSSLITESDLSMLLVPVALLVLVVAFSGIVDK